MSVNLKNEACCGLCYESYDHFQTIDLATKEILAKLQLDQYATESECSLMCSPCVDDIKQCYNFKSSCLYIENCINSFSSCKDTVELDITEIYLKRSQNQNLESLPVGHNVCRLCMNSVEQNYCFNLSDDIKEITSLKMQLCKYFPEIDLNKTQNPVICRGCRTLLVEGYFAFMDNCSYVKKKIKETGTEDASFFNETKIKWIPETKPNNFIKLESDSAEVKAEIWSYRVGIEEVNIKMESDEFVGHNDNLSAVAQRNLKPAQPPTLTYKCDVCTHKTNKKFSHILHTYMHRAPPKSPTHQSNVSILEEKTYSCELCQFTSKQKKTLNRHKLVHLSPSEVTMHRCQLCDYKTKRRGTLHEHIKYVHEKLPRVKTYNCEMCGHETNRKGHLNRHMAVHLHTSEATVFKCESCKFKTKHKGSLQRHLATHQNDSEVVRYHCDVCQFETKYKEVIRRHGLVHQSQDEVPAFQCDICDFKSKHKRSLDHHKVVHQNVAEITLFQCQNCNYKTKHKGNLRQHMVIHQRADEVTMYRCELCEFQTKYKCDVTKHALVHQEASEVEMFQCAVCEFKTKHKWSFRRHMGVVHKIKVT